MPTALVHRPAHTIESIIDRIKLLYREWFGWKQPIRVVIYQGHGSPGGRFTVLGRVLAGEPLEEPAVDAPLEENIRQMARRMLSKEIAFATVTCGNADQFEARCDEEGYFEISGDTDDLPGDGFWRPVFVQLEEPKPRMQEEWGFTGRCQVPTDADFGVISDIDDTIMFTGATSLRTMLKTTFVDNAHTRRPFPGVEPFYRALHIGKEGRTNPFFYVSSSPWNLYDFLVSFLDYHNLPQGTLCLRDLGIDREKLGQSAHGVHKSANIDAILTAHPDLNFVLVGDSGQHDPEIYASAVERHPGRIKAIFIRDVTGLKRREELTHLARELKAEHGVKMMLETDLLEPAKFAARKGWCDPRYVDDIRAAIERARDEPLELPPRRVFTKQTRRLLIAAGVGAAVATGVILWKRYQHEN